MYNYLCNKSVNQVLLKKRRMVFLFLLNILVLLFFRIEKAKANSVDSLKNLLHITVQDTARIDLLNKIVKEYFYSDLKKLTDSVEKYMQNAFSSAQQIHYKKGEADALLLKGKYELSRDH